MYTKQYLPLHVVEIQSIRNIQLQYMQAKRTKNAKLERSNFVNSNIRRK